MHGDGGTREGPESVWDESVFGLEDLHFAPVINTGVPESLTTGGEADWLAVRCGRAWGRAKVGGSTASRATKLAKTGVGVWHIWETDVSRIVDCGLWTRCIADCGLE